MDIKQKSLIALKWEIIGRVLNPLIFFGSTIVLSRILTPDDYGQLAVIQVFVVICISLLDFGFGLVLIQKDDIENIHFSSVFWLSFSFTLILSVFIIIFASQISLLLVNSLLLESYFYWIPVCLIVGVYINNQIFRLKREISFSQINISQIIATLVSSLIAIILAIKGYGAWSLIIQLITMYVIQTLVFLLITKWNIGFSFNLTVIKDMWRFGKVLFLGNSMEVIYFNLDALIIGKLFTPVDLGYYNRAKTVDSLVINFTSGTLSFLLPAFSKMNNDKEKLRNAFLYVLNGLSTIVFLLIGILYLCAEDVVLIVFGEQWYSSIGFFKILIIGSFAYPFGAVLVNLIISTGNSKLFIKNEIVKRVLLTIAFLIGFQFGIKGYLYCIIILSVVATILNAYFACKVISLPISVFFKNIYKYLIIMILITFAFDFFADFLQLNKWTHLIIISCSFTLLYFSALYIFRVYGFKILKTEVYNQIINKYVYKKYGSQNNGSLS